MKKLNYLIILFVMSSGVLFPYRQVNAQAPQSFNYQAVLRDASGAVRANTSVAIRVIILSGSATGTTVYSENHSKTTNSFGLVNLAIGKGSVVSGSMATIDWSNGTYYVKITVDGTDFGTSQLLSVPYALHAKTTETVTGTITETDPVYSASQAANITATDITNLIYLSGTNTGDQDISGIAINTQAIQDTAAQIRADIPSVKTYSVGDFVQGGIVFWLDETGQHGLVCAKADQSAGVRWYAGTIGNTPAKGDGPFAGEANTSIIIAAQVAIGDDRNTYAARICNELQITEGGKTYGDWYLPSTGELNLMFQNKSTINATAKANGGSYFSSGWYWSSNESSFYNAWKYLFGSGTQYADMKSAVCRVRAVRAF